VHGVEELDERECRELLSSRSVGRFAFWAPQGPQVFPVNYVVRGDAIVFRTSPSHTLAAALRNAPRGGFQVDDVDEPLASGWSVLVTGEATAVQQADDAGHGTDPWGDEAPQPWAGGDRSLHVRVAMDTVTGRRVMAS
jgi:nitroimidazol reductase NimA-like FMN-containing flavoprotein (pyridoxamine 5'-phosphate oxidase superfamily)